MLSVRGQVIPPGMVFTSQFCIYPTSHCPLWLFPSGDRKGGPRSIRLSANGGKVHLTGRGRFFSPNWPSSHAHLIQFDGAGSHCDISQRGLSSEVITLAKLPPYTWVSLTHASLLRRRGAAAHRCWAGISNRKEAGAPARCRDNLMRSR